MNNFRGHSYRTFAGAAKQLADMTIIIGEATHFVACQPSDVVRNGSYPMCYYPVVVYGDQTSCNVGALIHNKITVIN